MYTPKRVPVKRSQEEERLVQELRVLEAHVVRHEPPRPLHERGRGGAGAALVCVLLYVGGGVLV